MKKLISVLATAALLTSTGCRLCYDAPPPTTPPPTTPPDLCENILTLEDIPIGSKITGADGRCYVKVSQTEQVATGAIIMPELIGVVRLLNNGVWEVWPEPDRLFQYVNPTPVLRWDGRTIGWEFVRVLR